MDADDASADIFPVGTLLDGRYEIVRRLGAGGMGVVYEARHVRLGQSVAIKAIRGDVPLTQAELQRFEREARSAAKLRSRHAVRVFDIDTAPNGITYIAMELLRGNDLLAELAVGPTSGEVVDWVVQLCDALQEAHDAGIVHRDIKPENVFIAEDSDRRVAKLLDFGISKVLSESPSGTTVNSSVMGTPEYMSPEQIRARKVDHRSDIFSLGVLLYRMLADRLPFSADNGFPYLTAVVADPAIPLDSLRPDLPAGLVNVVMTALEKSPDDRFQSARAMAQALAPFAGGGAPLPSRSLLPLEDGPTVRDPSIAPPGTARATPRPEPATTPILGSGAPPRTVPIPSAPPRPPTPSARPSLTPGAVTQVAAEPAASRTPLLLAGLLVVAFALGFGAFLGLRGRAPSSPVAGSATTSAPPASATVDPPATTDTPAPPPTFAAAPSASASAPSSTAVGARSAGRRPAGSSSAARPTQTAAPKGTDEAPPFL